MQHVFRKKEVSLLSFLSICAGIEWELSAAQSASITSIVFCGEMIGALSWGSVADSLGRRVAFVSGTSHKSTLLYSFIFLLLIACAMIATGGALSAFAPNFAFLLLFRFIVGFGVGGTSVPFDLLAEFLPSPHRGRFLLCIELFWTFGSLFVGGVAWVSLSSHGWRFLAIVTAIPVTIALCVTLLLLPESPRWLLEKGRIREAEDVLRLAAARNGQVLPPFSLTPLALEQQHTSSCLTHCSSLLSAPHRWVSVPLWMTWLGFGFSYYGVILLVTRLFTDPASASASAGSCSFDYPAIFFNATSEVVGVMAAALFIDKLGRTRSQALLYLSAAVCVLCVGLPMQYSLTTFVSVMARLATMGASAVTWVATSELYPTKVRATGHAVCNFFARMGSFCCPYVVFGVSTREAGLLLFAVNMVAAVSSIVLPETKGM